MNLSKKLLELDTKSKEKKSIELRKRKTRNFICNILDCLKFFIITGPCIGVIIYLLVNIKEDASSISFVITIMSAIVFIYSILAALLNKYKYLLLDSLYVLIFAGGLIAALIIAIKIPDKYGVISAWISALCLIFTMVTEMIKGMVFYTKSYKQKNSEIDKQIAEINRKGSFS